MTVKVICKNCHYIQSEPILSCCQVCSAPSKGEKMENIWCCGSCGLAFNKDEGFVSKDSDTHFSFICFECKGA